MGLVKYDIIDNIEYTPSVDLGLVSDVLRYIFTWVPIMPQARALMALIQVTVSRERTITEDKSTILAISRFKRRTIVV